MVIPIILLAVLSLLVYWFMKPKKNYWEAYGVPQYNIGELKDNLEVFMGKKTVAEMDDRLYHMLEKTSEKFCGKVEMNQPILLVKDIEVLKKIMIKDFDHFVDRRAFSSENAQPIISKMVGNLKGEEWKGVRSSLSPTFTTGKIRRMMEFFNKVGNDWIEHLKNDIKKSDKDHKVIKVASETTHYTVDVIAAAVFGMNAGTIENPDSTFSTMCKKLSTTNLKVLIKFGIAVNFPKLADFLRLKIFDSESLEYFEAILAQGIKKRMDGTETRNDFLQLIAEARKGELKAVGSDELNAFEKEAQLSGEVKKNYLNDDLVANAQMLGFFFAGFSTTSNFIGFCMYCLALNPQVQEKLREEVDSQLFKDTKNIDYDDTNRLVYLDMVVCEVLRKYPPLNRLERKCVKEYFDPETGLRVPKDAIVAVPVQSIHNDPSFYDHPDKFYPEHFTPEKKGQRDPLTYLPFGTGPRNCIGMRFALVKSKAAVAHLVHNFFIEPSSKTPIPVKVQPVGFGVQLPESLELILRPRVLK